MKKNNKKKTHRRDTELQVACQRACLEKSGNGREGEKDERCNGDVETHLAQSVRGQHGGPNSALLVVLLAAGEEPHKLLRELRPLVVELGGGAASRQAWGGAGGGGGGAQISADFVGASEANGE